MKKEYTDELHCDICDKETKQKVRDGGHERDSSGDRFECLECGGVKIGLTGEWEKPFSENQPAQREILFRVIRNGKIVGYERLYETQWKWRHANSDRWIDGFYGNAPDLIRDQYTGITDKNGVKVFEGDKYTVANHITYEVQYRAESEHQYEKAYACFCLAVPERMVIPFDEYAVKNGAVTGNIHDKNEQEGEK